MLPAGGGGGAGGGHGRRAVGGIAAGGPGRPPPGGRGRGAGVGARLTDSALYGHLWGTEELRAIFDERARIQSWLDILATLAQAQAELGIIPEAAAKAIAAGAVVDVLDLEAVAEETRRTGH